MKKSLKIAIIGLALVIIGLVGFIVWDKVLKDNGNTNNTNKTQNSATTGEKETENETVKTTNQADNAGAKQKQENNETTSNQHVTSKELVVNREGSEETIPSKEHVNTTMGYAMRYASEYFKVSHKDNIDWFLIDGDINCVTVEKENLAYSKKIASISGYEKVSVNGYEAVYTTRRTEGQFETTYYINGGTDCTFIIVTSCQDTTEYLEGLGHVMDAMVQTFVVK